MNNQKKEFIYSIIVKSNAPGELVYQVNPELTMGIDPRNDVVLVGENISIHHLKFKEIKGELIVVQIGSDATTRLNNKPLLQNENYILNVNDQLRINNYKINIKRELSFRRIKSRNFDKQIGNSNQSFEGLNLSKEITQAEPEEIIVKMLEKNHLSEHTKIIKDAAFSFSINHLLNLIQGIFFDLIFCYFIVSLFPQIKIHLFYFFGFVEILCFYLLNSSLGQKFLSISFNRRFIFIPLIILFFLYPLSKKSFARPIKRVTFNKTNIIDLHSNSFETMAKDNKISLNSAIDSTLFILPTITNNHLILKFHDASIVTPIEIKFENALSIEKLNNFFYRTNLLKIPTKEKRDPISLKNFYTNLIKIDHANLKNLIYENGPFLSFINDTKSFFTDDLPGTIELVETSETSPTIILRNQKTANLFIIGEEQLFQFTYTRPINNRFEDIFIEKVLAKTNGYLINKKTNEIGFLEMFDSLPEINYQVLLMLMSQESKKEEYLSNRSLNLSMKNSLNEIILAIKSESRNAGPLLINDFMLLQNKFN